MCRAGVSRKLRKTILFLWTRGTVGSCGHCRHTLRRSYPVRQREREQEREESVQNEWRWAVFPFFSLSLSTLRSKWSKANKTERGRIRREGKLLWAALIPDCTVIASRAPFLSLSPLQPVTDDTAPVRNLGDSLQEHIHLRPNSSRP